MRFAAVVLAARPEIATVDSEALSGVSRLYTHNQTPLRTFFLR